MKQSILLSAIVMLGLSFSACKKDNPNNAEPYKPQLQYQLAATNTNYSVARTTATANLVWTSAYAYPKAIYFEAKQNNLKVSFTSTSDNFIDLMAPTATSFGGFALPAGTYDAIELKIKLDKHAADPAMQLNGLVSNGGMSIPVIVKVDENLELKTEQRDITITNEETYIAVTTINLADVTDGISADMLLDARLTDGSIVISPASNKDLYRIIVNNLRDKHHHCNFMHHHH